MINFFRFVTKRFNKKSRVYFSFIAMAAILSNLFMLVIPLLQKRIIDSIKFSNFDKKSIFLLLTVSLIGGIILIIESLVLNNLFMSLKNTIEMELLKSVVRKKNKIIEQKGAGAYMVSIFGDSEQIASLIGINYFSIFILCISTISILVISTKWSWVFISVVVPTYIIMILVLIISNNIYVKEFTKAREKVFELNPKVLEFIENRSTVIGYSDVCQYESSLESIFKTRDSHFKSAFAANTCSKTIIEVIRNVSMIVFFILSIIQILNNKMQISAFIALSTYFAQIFIPISSIQELTSGLNRFKTLKNKIDDSLKLETKYELPNNKRVYFNNCSFSYMNDNGSETDIIKDLSLEINKKIGIVGLSGEGKTTIIKMMLGELEAKGGQCIYGDKCISDISKFIIHSTIRVYSQEPEIFNNSLEFNITLGKVGVSEMEYYKKVEEITNTTLSCFSKFKQGSLKLNGEENEIIKTIFLISTKELKNKDTLENIKQNLPSNIEELSSELGAIIASKKYYIIEKYNEIINDLDIEYLNHRDFGQRGSKISGGEKNKVCLARVLLPRYKGYFLIDEPFTSLDLLAEKQCMEVLLKNIRDINGVIISHKLNVIRDLSDEIVVLEEGRITGRGTHESLIQNNELYSKLFEEYLIKQNI